MWFWRLRKSWCCGGCELQFKTLLLRFLFVFPHFFFLVCLRFGLWFRWSDEILTLRSSLSFGFIHGCGDSWMWRMRPQLWLWFGFGDSENFDVAATIAVAERNLKPCSSPSLLLRFPAFFRLFVIRFVIPLIRGVTYSVFLTFFWIHSRLHFLASLFCRRFGLRLREGIYIWLHRFG